MINKQTIEKLEFNKIVKSILNYAQTEPGKNEIGKLAPLDSFYEVLQEGRRVSEAKEILIHNESPLFEDVRDLSEQIARAAIEGSVLDAKTILEILKILRTARSLVVFLKSRRDSALILDYANSLYADKLLERNIEKIVTDSGEIKESASEKLFDIRKEIRNKNEILNKTAANILKNLSKLYLTQEDYSTQRDGRIVLPIKAEHKRKIKGFIHSESATGLTVYIEPEETLELNNELLSLSFAEKREVERLLKELTKLIGEKKQELLLSLWTIGKLDSIFARAKYSIEIRASMPELVDTNFLELIEARHPLLIKKLGRNSVVPLNLNTKDSKIIVITGPNAGGKTVALKTVGLLCLMVYSGIHIPAFPDSKLPFFENVFIDIGDQQSIEDDLSAFSSHLKSIKEILSEANDKTLILLDEIGRGTDPAEGTALASAVLTELHQKGSTVLATTHYGELKIFAGNEQGFQNSSMEFDNRLLSPTYRFKQGVPGSSFAFEVAAKIGFPEKTLNTAKKFTDPNKDKLENLLIELETKAKDYEDKLKTLEIENTRLQALTEVYRERSEKLKADKTKILTEVKIKADEYLKSVNKRIEETVKSIKESGASKNSIIKAKETIVTLKSEEKSFFKELKIAEKDENGELNIGDSVASKSSNIRGNIIEFSPDKKVVVLQSGSVRIKVKRSDLIKINKIESRASGAGARDEYSIITPRSFRLDIRGMRGDEAEYEIIRFVDDSYASGQATAEILHGKGTGALKKIVKVILESHNGVKAFYFAPIESGGDGVTVIEFKQ